MIPGEDFARLREELAGALAEDAHNTERLLERLDAIRRERGVGAHAALLLILTRLAFDDEEARRHWEAVLYQRAEMSRAVGRDVGIRVAILDYFTNVNRRLVQPTLIDLDMRAGGEDDPDRDALTGLATERRFRTALQNELRRAKRYEQPAAVVLFDVDDFAEINARHGTLVADRLLRELAILLRNNVRDIDIAARPGEDELAVLLPETDRNGALLVAERFRRQVATFFAGREASGGPVELTVSGGVACYPDDASAPEALLERAAQALYRAKAAGRNAIHLFQPERRRYLRFELEPGRFEIEVLAPPDSAARPRNLSRSGLLFASPERLEVGEAIEIRLIERVVDPPRDALRIRGRVVRLEELPEEDDETTHDGDRYEIGVAFDLEHTEGADDLLELLERARGGHTGTAP